MALSAYSAGTWPDEALWLIMAPRPKSGELDLSRIYPQDPKSLPPELAGRVWPPE